MWFLTRRAVNIRLCTLFFHDFCFKCDYTLYSTLLLPGHFSRLSSQTQVSTTDHTLRKHTKCWYNILQLNYFFFPYNYLSLSLIWYHSCPGLHPFLHLTERERNQWALQSAPEDRLGDPTARPTSLTRAAPRSLLVTTQKAYSSQSLHSHRAIKNAALHICLVFMSNLEPWYNLHHTLLLQTNMTLFVSQKHPFILSPHLKYSQ